MLHAAAQCQLQIIGQLEALGRLHVELVARDVDQPVAHADVQAEIGIKHGGARGGVDEGIAEEQINVAGQLAVQIDFQAPAARPADRHRKAGIGGIGGEHIVLGEGEKRDGAGELAIKQIELGAHFGRTAGLRIKQAARHVGTDIGAEAFAIGGIE